MLLGAADRGRRYYESRDFLTRGEADEPLAACPDCGGGLRNLAVARE
jgi:hypothetical protein